MAVNAPLWQGLQMPYAQSSSPFAGDPYGAGLSARVGRPGRNRVSFNDIDQFVIFDIVS